MVYDYHFYYVHIYDKNEAEKNIRRAWGNTIPFLAVITQIDREQQSPGRRFSIWWRHTSGDFHKGIAQNIVHHYFLCSFIKFDFLMQQFCVFFFLIFDIQYFG
jgi:hypothetical protein